MLIMESNLKSAIPFQIQLHPNDSYPGEEIFLFPRKATRSQECEKELT